MKNPRIYAIVGTFLLDCFFSYINMYVYLGITALFRKTYYLLICILLHYSPLLVYLV